MNNISRNYISGIIVFVLLISLFLFFPTNVNAGFICGGTINVDPINTGSPNPMKTIYAAGGFSEQLCSTSETKAINNSTPPSVVWHPQFINWGVPPFGDINLSYRVVYHKILSRGNECVADWSVIDNGSDGKSKFPQQEMGNTTAYTTTVPHAAGVYDEWPFPWPYPGPNVPSHVLNLSLDLKMNNGSTLPTGWYQVDVQPSCDGGLTWENDSLAAFFVKLDPTVPPPPPNCTTPTGTINVEVRSKPAGCATSVSVPVSGNTVNLIDDQGGSDSKTLTSSGSLSFSNLPARYVNGASCLSYDYDVKISDNDYTQYNICSNNDPTWNYTSPYWNYNVSNELETNSIVTLPVLYVEPMRAPSKWMSSRQGNVLVEAGNMDFTGSPTSPTPDVVIQEHGTVTVGTPGTITLTNGTIGPLPPRTNEVYSYQKYPVQANDSIKKILDIDVSSSNKIRVIGSNGTGQCNNIPALSGIEVLYFDSCSLTIDSDSYIPSSIDLVIVNGSLTVTENVENIDTSLVVDGNMVVDEDASGPEELNIEGFLWVKSQLSISRKINVDSSFEFINSEVLNSLIPSGSVHWIRFD